MQNTDSIIIITTIIITTAKTGHIKEFLYEWDENGGFY